MPFGPRPPRYSLLAALAGCLSPSSPATAATIEGYAWPPSVAQGETYGIYVSTDSPTFDVRILRQGATETEVVSISGVPGALHVVPDSAWAYGCDWPVTLQGTVPQTWVSGVYVAELTAASAPTSYAIFTVKEDDPGSTSRILFQNSTTTWQAYNNWGGKSLYPGTSTNGEKSSVVSFQRPYAIGQGRGHYRNDVFPTRYWEHYLVEWLESEGYVVEYCTNQDTHADPDLESHYDLFLSVGHDEYWSNEMRDNIEGRIARGDNVAIFSGNTCWWQIRFSPGLDQVICYKDLSDPLAGVVDSLVTVQWFAAPVLRPENEMTGVSWRNGGFVNEAGWYPASEGYGDYTAVRTNHWVYAGTGLSDGDEFGYASTIVGRETDGALYTLQGSLPVVTGTDGTPLSFEILATSPASHGAATMGIYQENGTVFNAATNDWSHGLASDAIVHQITRNVIDGLLLPATTAVPSVAGAGAGKLHVYPNPSRARVRIEWPGEIEPGSSVDIYSAAGRVVRRLSPRAGSAGEVAIWDGREASGRPMPSGVYFVRWRSPAGSRSAKLVLLRP